MSLRIEAFQNIHINIQIDPCMSRKQFVGASWYFRFTSNSFGSGLGFKLKYESIDGAPQWTYRIGAWLGEGGGTIFWPQGCVLNTKWSSDIPFTSKQVSDIYCQLFQNL